MSFLSSDGDIPASHVGSLEDMGGTPKIRWKTPKMDGENKGNPIIELMIWGYPYFFGSTHIYLQHLLQGCVESKEKS